MELKEEIMSEIRKIYGAKGYEGLDNWNSVRSPSVWNNLYLDKHKKQEMYEALQASRGLILFEEKTEPPGSSSLNYEKREGDYHCAGCGTKLFESKKKYESGSGWPSFFEAVPGVFETKIDNLIGVLDWDVQSTETSNTFNKLFEF